jgi:hypothetical protein
MMEAARTSETFVNFYQTTRCYNPEDSNLHTHRRENLKSYWTEVAQDADEWRHGMNLRSHNMRRNSRIRGEERPRCLYEQLVWSTALFSTRFFINIMQLVNICYKLLRGYLHKSKTHDDVVLLDFEDGDSLFLRNFGIYQRVYTAPKSRRISL